MAFANKYSREELPDTLTVNGFEFAFNEITAADN